MGTTLAVLIGLLAPSADAPSATYRVIEAATRTSTAGFSTPAARRDQAWAVVADQGVTAPSSQYMPAEIPHLVQPIALEDSTVVDGRYHQSPADCDNGTTCGKDGCSRCSGRLPNTWRARCDLPQHQPYVAEPKTYYYFRAYTYIHTPALQEEATLHGAPRRNPYDTKLFAGVYKKLRQQLKGNDAGVKAETPADNP